MSSLRGGSDWEHYIEDGLDGISASNGAFVSVLTPYSVGRPNGFCRNELALASSLGLRIIPLMLATVRPPASIFGLNYIDFRGCVPAEEHKTRYESAFQRLLDALHAPHGEFKGEQARLQRALQPIIYDEPARHLARFSGREWAFKEIEAWIQTPDRVLCIVGEAGTGKSALAAAFFERRPEIAGAHYCRYDDSTRSGPRALLSLAWQLATEAQEYYNRLRGCLKSLPLSV